MLSIDRPSVYIFLPQSDPHSFFSVWCLTLISYLHNYSEDKLILSKLSHSNVVSSFRAIPELTALDFCDFNISNFKTNDILCCHVHDESFQHWFIQNQHYFPSSLSVIFYTDGSNPYIYRRHLNYFTQTSVNFNCIKYIIFPASKYYYFWWTFLLKGSKTQFLLINQYLIIESYQRLKNHCLINLSNSLNDLRVDQNTHNLAFVILRPFDGLSDDTNTTIQVIANHILQRVKDNYRIILKADNRLSDTIVQQIHEKLLLAGKSVITLDTEFNSTPVEFILLILKKYRLKNLDIFTFDGSFIFNFFLLSACSQTITIYCEFPGYIWERLSNSKKNKFLLKLRMAKLLTTSTDKVQFDCIDCKSGSIFVYK